MEAHTNGSAQRSHSSVLPRFPSSTLSLQLGYSEIIATPIPDEESKVLSASHDTAKNLERATECEKRIFQASVAGCMKDIERWVGPSSLTPT